MRFDWGRGETTTLRLLNFKSFFKYLTYFFVTADDDDSDTAA